MELPETMERMRMIEIQVWDTQFKNGKILEYYFEHMEDALHFCSRMNGLFEKEYNKRYVFHAIDKTGNTIKDFDSTNQLVGYYRDNPEKIWVK